MRRRVFCSVSRPRSLFSWGLTVAALSVLVVLSAGCQDQRIRELERQNYLVRNQVEELQGLLVDARAELSGERTSLQVQLSQKDSLARDLAERNAALVANLEDLKAQYDEALDTPVGSILPPEVAAELAEVSQGLGSEAFTLEGNVLRFRSDILFDSGKAEVKPEPRKVLSAVARVLNSPEARDLFLRIDGHTDDQPIKYSRWEDNLELSAARARKVLLSLLKDGVDPHRMYLAAFGEYYPREPNATPEGRRGNRRVEIYLLLESPIQTSDQ